MKNLFFLFLILIFTNSFAQSGWVRQNSGTSLDLLDLQFINSNTGFVIGRNNGSPSAAIFLKTTNGGTNWFSSNFSSESFFTLGFIDVNTGVISSGYNYRRTTNGGSTWTPITNLLGVWMAKINFRNSITGFAFGPSSIDYTSDAGLSWQHVLVAGKIFLNDAVFLSQSKVIAIGSDSYKSTNGGMNWTYTFPGAQYGISNFDSNNVMSCGWYFNAISKSTNGGINWATVYSGIESDTAFFSVKYFDANNAVVVGSAGKILYTSNGGINWTQQISGIGSSLMRLTFINSQTGWIVGKNGVILKTTTGGVVTGFTQTSSEIPDKFSLSQNYPNPFNPSTQINYELPITNYVSLKVYDNLGNEVETLVAEKQNTGSYSVDFNATSLPSGIYFYKLTTEKFSETKKMILIK